MPATLQSLWNDALGFAFYYPLFMSWLWMAGAAVFWWQNERGSPPADRPVRRPDHRPEIGLAAGCVVHQPALDPVPGQVGLDEGHELEIRA